MREGVMAMPQTIIVFLLVLSSLPTFASCDPNITLNVERPFTSESEPTVVAASATSGCRITALSVYVDFKLIYQQQNQNTLDGRLDSVEYTGDHIPYSTKSPVRVGMVAHSDSAPISSMRLYIDGINYAQTWGSSGYCLPVALMSLKPGYHFINVQAWDALGHILLTGSILQVVP
jgi:hypothetical protein